MDLNRQLYLVVNTELPVRSADHLSDRFKDLRISAAELRKQMDPDAFILTGPGEDRIYGIYRIPTHPEETFAADFFRELTGRDVKTQDIWFQWD